MPCARPAPLPACKHTNASQQNLLCTCTPRATPTTDPAVHVQKLSQRPHLVHARSMQRRPCSQATNTLPNPVQGQQQPIITHARPVQGQPRSQTHTPVQRVSPRCTSLNPARPYVIPPHIPRCHPGVAHTPGVWRGRGQPRRRACPLPATARPRRAAGTQTSRDRGARGPSLTTCSPPPTGVRRRPSHSASGAAEDCNSQRATRDGATPPFP